MDDSLKQFVLDQLTGIDGVVCRAMFGGHGLYRGGTFFGILFKGRLYFKTDKESAREYDARGMDCFRPSAGKRMTRYREVPGDIIDDAAALCAWALRSIDAAGD